MLSIIVTNNYISNLKTIMDKLLKEAIADAKTVRHTALENAKIALEEAFAPKLQSMLSARITEEEDEVEDEDKKEVDETTLEDIDFTSETKDEDEDDAAEEVDETKDADEDDAPAEDEEETDESLDLDAIIAELEKEAGEDEKEEVDETKDADEDDKDEEEVEEAKKEDSEEEIDLDELLAELEKGEDEEKEEDSVEEINSLKAELAEYREAVVFLKDKINEVNLLNAKLLYTNKLFKNFSMTNNQKIKVLESLDRTKSVREVKLVYSTLCESLNETSKSSKKKITESLGIASKKTGKTEKAIINEGTSLADRFRELANLPKKTK